MSAIERQGSLGSAAFAERLALGQESAKNGEGGDIGYMDAEEDDRLEDSLKDCPQAGTLSSPQATQVDDNVFGDDTEDEAMKQQLKDKFTTLNAMTYRLKELWAQKSKAQDAGIDSPYEMLDVMRTSIDDQEDGEQKLYDTQVFNAICAIFEETRKNEGLRKFVAGVFSTQDQYYEAKARNRSVNMELEMLQELYNEKETEQEMARLKERQAAKMEAIKAKGAVRAQKAAEKAASGESSKKRKV